MLTLLIAWSVAAEPDLRLVAEDYALSADTERLARRALIRMFRVYEDVLDLQYVDPTPIHVRLIADRNTYNQRARALGLTQPTLGFFSPQLGEGVVWKNVSSREMRATLLHEASHYLMSRGGARGAPLWLHEGMAVMFGHARVSGNAVYLEAPSGMGAWLRQSGKQLPPIGTLLGNPAVFARLPRTPVGPAPYGVGWAICAFLMSRNDGKRLLSTLLHVPPRQVGPSMVAAVEAQWPGGVRELDREWRAWFSQSSNRIQLPIAGSAAGREDEGWIRCTNGSLIRKGHGLRCP